MLAPAMLETLRFNPLPDAGETFLRNRLAIRANCNLLDELPQIDGFFSMTPREASVATQLPTVHPEHDFSALLDFLARNLVDAERIIVRVEGEDIDTGEQDQPSDQPNEDQIHQSQPHVHDPAGPWPQPLAQLTTATTLMAHHRFSLCPRRGTLGSGASGPADEPADELGWSPPVNPGLEGGARVAGGRDCPAGRSRHNRVDRGGEKGRQADLVRRHGSSGF
jgi:hypothetical protein